MRAVDAPDAAAGVVLGRERMARCLRPNEARRNPAIRGILVTMGPARGASGSLDDPRPGDVATLSADVGTRGGAGAPVEGRAQMGPGSQGRGRSHAVAPGDRIGRFVVLAKIGAGGMGVVYAAYDPELDRRVAIKRIRDRGRPDDVRRIRLQREAQAMARLSHPNVITVYDVGEFEGDVYVAMEFVEGDTLGAYLRQRQPSVREIIRIFCAAGRGLAAAHAAGLVHRDFKPDNVLIDAAGRVRVMDFGLATVTEACIAPSSSERELPDRVADARPDLDARTGRRDVLKPPRSVTASSSEAFAPLTRTGALLGTPAYMSPEQHLGAQADARSDQFSFCVALFEALWGKRPFEGDQVASLALNVVRGRVRPVPSTPRVPAHVRRAVLRGLSANPDERFPSMDELLAELERDPGRRLRRLAIWGLVASAVGGTLWWAEARRVRAFEACAGAAAPMQRVWNESLRGALEQTLRSALPTGTEATVTSVLDGLDRYSAAWSRARKEACLDTRIRKLVSETVLDARMACLDARARSVRTLLDELAQANRNTALQAAQAVEALPDVDVCYESDYALRRWGGASAASESRPLWNDVGAADAKFKTGQYEAAVRLATKARKAAAGEAGLVAAEAAADLVLGESLERLGRFQASAQALERALVAGLSSGRVELAFDAARALAHTTGYRLAQTEAGLAWSRVARAVGQVGPRRQAELENAIGSTLWAAGRRAEALAHYERAVAALEGRGAAVGTRAWAMNNLAVALAELGQLDRARRLHEQALALRRERFGPGHPEVAVSLANLAALESRAENLDRAQQLYRRAYEIRRTALGERHVDVAGTLNNLGSIAQQTGRLDEAAAAYEQAFEILRERLGLGHPNVAIAGLNLGGVLLEQGREDAAIVLLQRVRAALGSSSDPEIFAEVTDLLSRALLRKAGGTIRAGADGAVHLGGADRLPPALRRRIVHMLDEAVARLGTRTAVADTDLWDMVTALRAALR